MMMNLFDRVVEEVKELEFFKKIDTYSNDTLLDITIDRTEKHPLLFVYETNAGFTIGGGEFRFDPFNQEFYINKIIDFSGYERRVKVIYTGSDVINAIDDGMREFWENTEEAMNE